MSKRIPFALIPMIFLGLFGSLKTGFAASDSTVVALDPAVSCEVVGNDIFVDVKISNVANLHYWGFQAFYETDYLDAIDAEEGPFLKSFAGSLGTNFAVIQINDAYNATHGLVWALCLMNDWQASATGSGVLATIEFRGTAAGMSHMCLVFPGAAYPVILRDMYANVIPCTTTTGVDALTMGPESVPLDVDIDVGTLYFAGEQVEFYILTTYRGISVTPTHISAELYNPEGESLSLTPQAISTGFYKVTYTMPSDASAGTWAIIVDATYLTDAIQTHGTSFKTYLFSSTLNSKLIHIEDTVAWIQTNVGVLQTSVSDLKLRLIRIEDYSVMIWSTLGVMQGTITSINNNIATIRTDIGTIKLDISDLESHVVAIEDSTATIQTTIGTMQGTITSINNNIADIQTDVGLLQVDVSDLELHVTTIQGNIATIQSTLGTMQGTITSINNNIATISTDIGTIKLDVSTVKGYTTPKAVDWTTIGLYVSLALLVSIVVVLVVLYFYLRARFRSGAVLS